MERHIDTDGFYGLAIDPNRTQIAKSLQFSPCTFLCITLLEIPHIDSDACFKLKTLFVTQFSIDLPLYSHGHEVSIGHCICELVFWPCGFFFGHHTRLALSFPFLPCGE